MLKSKDICKLKLYRIPDHVRTNLFVSVSFSVGSSPDLNLADCLLKQTLSGEILSKLKTLEKN
jgi:hypothetical protein